jgi:hypothetical protein
MQIDCDFVNILGEVLWHSATLDPSLETISRDHMTQILTHVPNPTRSLTFLEVAAYSADGYDSRRSYREHSPVVGCAKSSVRPCSQPTELALRKESLGCATEAHHKEYLGAPSTELTHGIAA